MSAEEPEELEEFKEFGWFFWVGEGGGSPGLTTGGPSSRTRLGCGPRALPYPNTMHPQSLRGTNKESSNANGGLGLLTHVPNRVVL